MTETNKRKVEVTDVRDERVTDRRRDSLMEEVGEFRATGSKSAFAPR